MLNLHVSADFMNWDGTLIVPSRATNTSPPIMTQLSLGLSSSRSTPDRLEHISAERFTFPSCFAQYGTKLVWEEPFTCALRSVR